MGLCNCACTIRATSCSFESKISRVDSTLTGLFRVIHTSATEQKSESLIRYHFYDWPVPKIKNSSFWVELLLALRGTQRTCSAAVPMEGILVNWVIDPFKDKNVNSKIWKHLNENLFSFRKLEAQKNWNNWLQRWQAFIRLTLADGLCENHSVLICHILFFFEFWLWLIIIC